MTFSIDNSWGYSESSDPWSAAVMRDSQLSFKASSLLSLFFWLQQKKEFENETEKLKKQKPDQ